MGDVTNEYEDPKRGNTLRDLSANGRIIIH
jgi:hypothetical protein